MSGRLEARLTALENSLPKQEDLQREKQRAWLSKLTDQELETLLVITEAVETLGISRQAIAATLTAQESAWIDFYMRCGEGLQVRLDADELAAIAEKVQDLVACA